MMDDAKKLAKFDAIGQDDPQRHQPAPVRARAAASPRSSASSSSPPGGSLIVRDGERQVPQDYDNEAGRAALQFYVDAVQKYKVDDPKVQHDADAFVAGTTAMLFREAWVIGEIQEKNPTLDYGVVPIPSWTAGEPEQDAAAALGHLRQRQERQPGRGLGLPASS